MTWASYYRRREERKEQKVKRGLGDEEKTVPIAACMSKPRKLLFATH